MKVQQGDLVLVFNPPAKESKVKVARFGADLALVSLNHPDMNGASLVSHGEPARHWLRRQALAGGGEPFVGAGAGGREPFVIAGPGEYETKGVAIRGIASESNYGGEKRINTVYTIALEGMKLAFVGALGKAELTPALKEALGDLDILFVPIGGGGVLAPAEAYKLAVTLEARLIIPIHFAGLGEAGALKAFLKEAGEDKLAAVEKLTLKKKDLEGKEGEVAVLSASA